MSKVLVVDDSPTMRRMVMASLKGLENIQFEEASNGLEAIENLTISPFDLMILDLNMPDIHGLEVLKFVLNHPDYQGTPIIILTTKGDPESRHQAFAFGASYYLTKPFQPNSLAHQVENLLYS